MSILCCDVCFELFSSASHLPLVICSNGHTVCSTCSNKINSCPSCRAKCLDSPITNIYLLRALDNLVSLKILVIGESGVGKSSLMFRFTDDQFSQDISPTIGLDFRVKVMDHMGFSVKLSIWDTAGQERFKNITSSYYRGAHGVILAYDLTSRRSFEDLDNWLVEEAKYSRGRKTIKLVVGNKSDEEERREVSYKEGREWAERRGCLFLETSAKQSSGVERVFYNLVERIVQEPGVWEEDGGLQGGRKVKIREGEGETDHVWTCCS